MNGPPENLWQFILAMDFWHWIGVFIVLGGLANCVYACVKAICNRKCKRCRGAL